LKSSSQNCSKIRGTNIPVYF